MTIQHNTRIRLLVGLGTLLLLMACNLVGSPEPIVVTATPSDGVVIPTANADGVVILVATAAATSTPQPVAAPNTPPSDQLTAADRALFNGNFNLAVNIYEGIVQQAGADESQRAAAYYGLGEAALREGLFGQAAVALTDFINRYPSDSRLPQAYFLRGDAYMGLLEWTAAISDFTEYLRLRPGIIDSYAYERIGDSYLALGQPDLALQNYRAASEATRSLVPLLQLRERLAATYSNQGNYTEAVAQYDAILAVAQNTAYRAGIEYQAALAEINGGLTDRGYARMQAVTTLYPSTNGAYRSMQTLLNAGFVVDNLLRGQISFANEDYGDAIAALNTYSAETGTLPASSLLLLGQAYRALGNYDAAYSTFQTLLDTYPNDPLFGAAWLDQGRTRYWSGDVTGAIARYTELSQTYPDSPEAAEGLWRAGYLYANELSQPELALSTFDTLSAQYPGDEWAQDGLLIAVNLANNLGYSNRVIEFYTELANTGTGENKAMAFLWLGKLYFSQGRTELAQDMFLGASQADPGGYYSLRAADIRAGAVPFTPPPAYQFEFDESVEIAEAEQWLRNTFGITQQGALYPLSTTLQNDPHMIRGNELWAVAAYEEAEQEFATLRSDYAGDALSTYQLAHYYAELGLYVESLRAGADLINLAGVSTYDAPSYIARLRYPIAYDDLVIPESQANDLDPLLVFALIRQESLFQSYATSFAAAQGLMQIIPDTGDWIATQLAWPNYQNSDLYRPYLNVRFGTYYLRWVLDFVDQVPYAALAGYNGGPGNARNWLDSSGEDLDRFVETVAFDESRTYVRRIYQQYDIYRYLYGVQQ